MSLILDALRKSESERQRKSAPQISDVPTGGRRQGTPRWFWIVAALLAVNAAVLAGLLLRSNGTTADPVALTDEQRPGPAVAEPAPTAPQPSGNAAVRARPAPVEPEPQDPAPAAQDAAPADANPAPAQAAATPTVTERAAEPAGRVPPSSAGRRDDRQPTETLLTFNDVRASGNVGLPDLHVDLHVYSDVPADRFVFINMKQYREQATLDEGPEVVEITPEGVILDYSGTTFLLPRD